MQAYVIGAGPTGLSASLALRKFAPKRFKRVKLVDLSFKMNHEENVGVGIWKNAFAALLNIINCPEELQKKGRWSRPAAYRRYTDGKWLSQASNSAKNAERIFLLKRQDLCEFLFEECIQSGVEVFDNTKLESYSWNENGEVMLEFTSLENQNPSNIWLESADLVVIATGQKRYPSNKKEAKMGVISGLTNIRLDSLQPYETIDLVYWFATMRSSDFRNIVDAEYPQVALLAHFKEFHSPIPCILQKASENLEQPILNLVYTSRSGQNFNPIRNVYVLGDSAFYLPHNLAQGASLGIEQSYMLGLIYGSKAVLEMDCFDRVILERHRRCKFVTGFTNFLTRNVEIASLMAYVPPEINGRVFDSFLDYSLYSSRLSRIINETAI